MRVRATPVVEFWILLIVCLAPLAAAQRVPVKIHGMRIFPDNGSLFFETQAKVSRSLEQLRSTRLVIAHRLSTVCGTDLIIVLENGCKLQEGAFQELLRTPGVFADLARRQMLTPRCSPQAAEGVPAAASLAP